MPSTAIKLVTKALSKILVQASEQSPEAIEITDAIDEMNDMMAELDARGISLGYTVVTDPSDILTVSDGALAGITSNLAVRLAPEYDEPISVGLAASAESGMRALRRIGITIEPTLPGGNVPIGSGNEGDAFGTDHFYPEIPDSVLDEANGNILLEDET